MGKGEALKTGIRNARGENIIWVDADDTYPLEKIPEMALALQDSFDLVYTSRRRGRQHIPVFNRIGNALFRLLTRRIYGFRPDDPCAGLCGVKKRRLEAMELVSSRFGIESEIAAKAGRMKLRVLNMPIEYRKRVGEAKLSRLTDGLDILVTILRFLFWRPRNDRRGERA